MNNLASILIGELGLSLQQADLLQQQMRTKILSKKAHLIEEGSVCDMIGIVLSGTLRSYVRNANNESNNDFYLPGSLVSAYTSYLTQSPTNCNIQALTNAEVLYITRQNFDALIAQDPQFLKLAKYIADNYFIRKCRRETSFLKNTAAERLANLQQLYPGIEQQVSQYHIASYLGIKPESLSRVKLLTYINK